MADIGQTFRAAREGKKVSCSQAAAATRMKVQHIEALERGDFSYMAAPAYAKGFIRLYADYLGLDPEPLIREYMERHAPAERPSLLTEEKNFSGPSFFDVASRQGRRVWAVFRPWLLAWRKPLLVGCGVVALLLVGRMLLRDREKAPPVADGPSEPGATVRPAEAARPPLPVLREPPDAYLEGARRTTEGTPPSGPAR
jgi:cytoskeletal protein RodZ